jgi:hypothetical protein
VAEGINETGFQEVIERFTFLWSEACNLIFTLWIIYIDVLVCNIKITGYNDRLLLFLSEFVYMCLKVSIPFFNSVVESFQSISGIWHIGFNQYELLELGSNDSALTIVLCDPEIISDREWLNLSENSSPRIASLNLAAVPILLVVTRYLLVIIHLVHLVKVYLDLIQANDGGVGLLQKFLEVATLYDRIEAIYIPVPDGDIIGLKFGVLGCALKLCSGRTCDTEKSG